ncbi:hypothetical protein J7L68_01330 [bacterium]|nr:hypothetical protein [bacterium]
MAKRHNISINALIEQGYRIADDKWSGKVWKLPETLRTNFDVKIPMMK